MFDSQKLSFDKWLMGYKHGVYVFTSDSCSVCKDFKESIKDINNHYLYFVEVVTEKQKEIVAKLTHRSAFPQTAAYKDNQLDFVRMGMLFDTQMAEIMSYLKQFGDAPLSPEDLKERISDFNNKCELALYGFTQTTTAEQKAAIMDKALQYKECPIDIDAISPGLTIKEREQVLKGLYWLAKLTLFKDGKSNMFSPLTQQVILGYCNAKHDAKFDVRMIDEVLK